MQEAEKLGQQHGQILFIVLIEALQRCEPPLLGEFMELHENAVLYIWGVSEMQIELVVYAWDHEIARGNTSVAVDLIEVWDYSKVFAHFEKVGLVDGNIKFPKVQRARDHRLRVVIPQRSHYQDVDLFKGLSDPTHPGIEIVILSLLPLGSEHLRVVS